MSLPYLTAHLPGTGGVIRMEHEDFSVEELPLYLASGEGEHVMAEIEKRGISTNEAVARLAKAAGVAREEIGYAGLKDARAVARQRLTIPRVEPRKVLGLSVPGVRVISVSLHRNKLRPGHLAGNRFIIRVREAHEESLKRARAVLDVLAARGVPNGFGPQRFGERGDGHMLGAALLSGDAGEFLALMLGRPAEGDPQPVRRSRELFEAGDIAGSMKALPDSRREERAALRALEQGRKPEAALRAVSKRLRLFLISALQSHLFNRVLEARMPDIDRVEPGDLAWKHDSGAVFKVVDAGAENERAARREISPSGPLFGFKMISPEGRPGEIERGVLANAGLTLDSFRPKGGLRSEGARRPLRIPLGEPSLEPAEGGYVVSFNLPPGSYATVVLGELMKAESPDLAC